MKSKSKQRREGEANGPQWQRPVRVSRRGPSWTEFVRPADQAVVANGGADMINRAERRACGYSRPSRRLDNPISQLNSGEDGGAIEAFGELRRLRINIIQEAVERSVGEQGRPVEQIGRGFNEATRAGWAGERKLEIPVGQ